MAATSSSELLSLPDHPDDLQSWPPQILKGYSTLRKIYNGCLQMLSQPHEAVRLRTYENLICDDAVPILQACADMKRSLRPQKSWIKQCAQQFGQILRNVKKARLEAEDNIM